MSNNRKGNKKLSLLLVLRALELMSDDEHPINQVTLTKMVNQLGEKFNNDLWCDRKTVGKHLKTLSAVGYKIVYIKGKGCYLESNKFTRYENELLIKLIEDSSLNLEIKNNLILKLKSLENAISTEKLVEYFKNNFDKVSDDNL